MCFYSTSVLLASEGLSNKLLLGPCEYAAYPVSMNGRMEIFVMVAWRLCRPRLWESRYVLLLSLLFFTDKSPKIGPYEYVTHHLSIFGYDWWKIDIYYCCLAAMLAEMPIMFCCWCFYLFLFFLSLPNLLCQSSTNLAAYLRVTQIYKIKSRHFGGHSFQKFLGQKDEDLDDFYARQHICYSTYMSRQFHLSVHPSVTCVLSTKCGYISETVIDRGIVTMED